MLNSGTQSEFSARACDAVHIASRDDSRRPLRRMTQTAPAPEGHDRSMKANFPIERRPIVPRHRDTLRGVRRTRPARRHALGTRCGYLLVRTFG